MDKKTTKELEELSLKAFGNKHYYRKYMDTGVLVKDPDGGVPRRQRFSIDGVKFYMIKYIEGRQKLISELKEKREKLENAKQKK